MRTQHIIYLLAAAMLAISCSDKLPDEQGKESVTLSFVTRALGAKNIQGISESEPYWGLYVYSLEGDMLIENAKMKQAPYESEDFEYTDDDDPEKVYKTSYFADGPAPDISSLGGLIISAYYPWRETAVPNNFPDEEEDISPRRTTNSQGQPMIHYGIPDYRLARHPDGYKIDGKGYFNYGAGHNPPESYQARDIVLFTCYKYVDATTLTSGNPVKIDLTPATCRLEFVFSVAPRKDSDGNLMDDDHQPKPADYEIVSVCRRRTGLNSSSNNATHNNFNYNLATGKIQDMKFKSGGLYFKFPDPNSEEEEERLGYNSLWGPVRPYSYDTPKEDMVPCIEFVSFPTVYDELQNIMLEIFYRYRIIGGDTPDPDDDVWVTSRSVFPASALFLIDGWESGVIYRYHIYIDRREVDYDVELIPWDFDPEKDQFFGDIQV